MLVPTKKTINHRNKKRKYRSLSGSTFRLFLKHLKNIHKASAVVAEILWFLNKSIHQIGNFITLEEILRLQVQNIALVQEKSKWICLYRLCSKHSHSTITVHYLPDYLWKRLCQLINSDSPFVFSNRNGGPILSVQIDKLFKKAGKSAGITKSVTSLSLRPSCGRISSEEKHLQEVSPAEWRQLCHKFPSPVEKRGRKSKYCPRTMLNGILYHLRTGCPFRKLPLDYPPGLSIDSQYRRWKRNGIFDDLLRERKN